MTPTLDSMLADLEAKAKAATRGVWRYDPKDGRRNQNICCMEEVIADYDPRRTLATVTVTAWKPDGYKSAVPNAAHIAATHPDAILALISAIKSDRERHQWQPMNTAPKDGTRVLLFNPLYGAGSGHFDVRWHLHFCLNKDAEPTRWMHLPTDPRALKDKEPT